MNKIIISIITLLTGSLLSLSLTELNQNDIKRIEINAVEGLQFDPARFVVEPGQEVELVFHNIDDMLHNLLITEPGTREDVATMALSTGMDEDFIPDTESVLWATEVISPGETVTLRFTAPEVEGDYPYVCTFPGHAARMFGVMYVTSDGTQLPDLADDMNVPDYIRESAGGEEAEARFMDWEHNPANAPRRQVRRTFVRDAGPSAIGVHAGRNLSFIWDADTAHLRYAWWGGFLDSEDHWLGNQSAFSEVEGHIYYRAGREFPIRLGEPSHIPERRFFGYEIIDDLPQFEYEMDGYNVHQYVTALEHETGLRMEFEIEDTDQTVYYITDPEAGVAFISSAGEWNEGVLELSPAEARSFSIDMIERPGTEPIGFWSMNDDPWTQFQDDRVRDGVVGRSLHFEEHEKTTAIYGEDVDAEMTFAGWVNLQDRAGNPGHIFGQRDGETGHEFSLVYRDNAFVFNYRDVTGEPASEQLETATSTGEWIHFMWTRSGGEMTLYVNGESRMDIQTGPLLEDQLFTIGASHDAYHVNAYLDQFHVWRRVLDDETLDQFYRSQASRLQ